MSFSRKTVLYEKAFHSSFAMVAHKCSLRLCVLVKQKAAQERQSEKRQKTFVLSHQQLLPLTLSWIMVASEMLCPACCSSYLRVLIIFVFVCALYCNFVRVEFHCCGVCVLGGIKIVSCC